MSVPHTERSIAGYLARVIFERRHLLLVPNCQWPGSECDLLVVTPNLRIIDVEIKISRADLKADANKDKWFEFERYTGVWPTPKKRIQYPKRIWKHYYCLPRAIWKPELYDCMNPVSGVLLIDETGKIRDEVGYGVTRIPASNGMRIMVERRAKPDTKAEKISAEDAIDIARLASLRMWDAYEKLDRVEAVPK